jgi:hypothetical protein
VAPADPRVEVSALAQPRRVALAGRQREDLELAPRLDHVQPLGAAPDHEVEVGVAHAQLVERAVRQAHRLGVLERLDPGHRRPVRQQIEQRARDLALGDEPPGMLRALGGRVVLADQAAHEDMAALGAVAGAQQVIAGRPGAARRERGDRADRGVADRCEPGEHRAQRGRGIDHRPGCNTVRVSVRVKRGIRAAPAARGSPPAARSPRRRRSA